MIINNRQAHYLNSELSKNFAKIQVQSFGKFRTNFDCIQNSLEYKF